MTMQKLCGICQKLSAEFNAAVKKMDTAEFSEYRKRLAIKYNAGFDNGWTLRIHRRISDNFTIDTMQIWTQTKKGLLGKRSGSRILLTLRSTAAPELSIRCTSTDGRLAKQLHSGGMVKVTGELELTAFLRTGNVEWKTAEFGEKVRISAKGK